MFSSALKSFTSNISSNYTISANPSSISGLWKVFDGTKKSTGKAASIFVFDRKSLETQGGSFNARSGAASLKKAQDEVVERLKKEASSLARLRHPSILELVEPIEETRNGGLMFATESVTASLAGLLQEKDNQQSAGGYSDRKKRYVVEDRDGETGRKKELELDELEIQKGLLQIGKGLEFLHESAGLVHGNLTPEAIFVNAKSDWKISGLGFSGPLESSSSPTSGPPICLSEVLTFDARLPRAVQMNLDYASPDFVLDSNVTSLADLFSLGLLIIALYNTPHKSPLETNGSLTHYKKLFNSPSSVPSQNNNFLSSKPLPRDILSSLLPRLITRRPAQRMTAREFQQAQYFDNVLVSTIRFLESLPAKTPNEKLQFMRGLPRILGQFPKTVLERKVLPGLLDELKDRELLSVVLQNIFKIIEIIPSGNRAFSEKVIPKLRETFLSNVTGKAAGSERDALKEGGIKILLENMTIIKGKTTGKEFKDDILPLIYLGLESPTHSLVDASLKSLAVILPALDYTTIKNELFPVVASVFSKTSSMGIKISGLESLRILCGGTSASDLSEDNALGDLTEVQQTNPKHNSSAALDKYTVQEKVVPLLKAIKTKEPAIMMGALEVFKQVGKIADIDFLAIEVIPILWAFGLGPLLNLEQFQAHMSLIKTLSARIEQEQTRKLQELSSSNTGPSSRMNEAMPSRARNGASMLNGSGPQDDVDFESLVTGRKTREGSTDILDSGWDSAQSPSSTARSQTHSLSNQANVPTFSWSTPTVTLGQSISALRLDADQPKSRAITPDQGFGNVAALQPSKPSKPSTSTFPSQILQPSRPGASNSTFTAGTSSNPQVGAGNVSSLWSAPNQTGTNISLSNFASQTLPLSPLQNTQQHTPSLSNSQPTAPSPYAAFTIARPPPPSSFSTSNAPLRPGFNSSSSHNATNTANSTVMPNASSQKQGLDKYESLL